MEDKICHNLENCYYQIPPEAGKIYFRTFGNKQDYDIKGGTHMATSNYTNTELRSRAIRTNNAIDFSNKSHNSRLSYDLKSGIGTLFLISQPKKFSTTFHLTYLVTLDPNNREAQNSYRNNNFNKQVNSFTLTDPSTTDSTLHAFSIITNFGNQTNDYSNTHSTLCYTLKFANDIDCRTIKVSNNNNRLHDSINNKLRRNTMTTDQPVMNAFPPPSGTWRFSPNYRGYNSNSTTLPDQNMKRPSDQVITSSPLDLSAQGRTTDSPYSDE